MVLTRTRPPGLLWRSKNQKASVLPRSLRNFGTCCRCDRSSPISRQLSAVIPAPVPLRHQPPDVDFPLKPLSAATFGDDVPVVRAGSPLLQLLAEGEQIKTGKQTDERGGIAIAMRVAFSLDLVDDESVGSDRAANAIIRIAGRQHRHL